MNALLRAALVFFCVAFASAAAAQVFPATSGYSVQTYGAAGDGITDDWWAIQQTINAAAASGGGTVIIPNTPGATYRIAQALRMASGVSIYIWDDITIKCTGDYAGKDPTGASNLAQWPTNGCLLFGSGEGDTLNSLPLFNAGPIVVGQTSVVLQNLNDAQTLVVGDLILVQTTHAYDFFVGGTPEPRWGRMAQVTAINGTTITYDRPIDPDASYASSLVRKLTNGRGTPGWPTLENSNIPAWATIGAGVTGGNWFGKGLPWTAGGAALDCKQKPHTFVGGFGIGYTNMLQSCELSVVYESVSSPAMELSYNSRFNTADIGTIVASGTPANRQDPGWIVAVNENGTDNRIKIGALQSFNSANPWLSLAGTVSGGGGDGLTVTITRPGLSTLTASYTTISGDSLASVQTAIVGAINAQTAAASSDITATSSPFYPGVILMTSASGVPYNVSASGANSVIFYVPGNDIVHIGSGQRNTIEVASLTGGNVAGNIVRLTSSAIFPQTSENTVTIGSSNFPYQGEYVDLSGAQTKDNLVQNGRFLGEVYNGVGFSLDFGIGGNNVLSGLSGYGSTASVACRQSDFSNTLKDIYTTAPEAVTYNNFQISTVAFCKRQRVGSASWVSLMSGMAEWVLISNINSAFGQFLTTSYPANSLQTADGIVITIRGNKIGSAAVATGHVSAQGCQLNFSIPADATTWIIIYEYDALSNQGRCQQTIQTDSVTTPGSLLTTNSSFIHFDVSAGMETTFAATTGSDILQIQRMSARAIRPSYDNTQFRQ